MSVRPFRVGDLVTVVDPRIVLRVGYPMHIPTVAAGLRENDAVIEAAGRLMEAAGVFGPTTAPRSGPRVDDRAYGNMIRELAAIKVKALGWGGDTRSLHLSEPDEGLRDRTVRVLAKKVVKTGTRVRGYDGGMWSDDSESPSFEPDGTHVLLLVDTDRPDFLSVDHGSWIPARHVVLPELYAVLRRKKGHTDLYLHRNGVNNVWADHPDFRSQVGRWPLETATHYAGGLFGSDAKDWTVRRMQ